MEASVLPREIDTIVVGGGQAGLTMSWYLRQSGREHVVLERRDSLGGGWQDRWDAFRLVTPNWAASLPGYAYDGDDPDGFMPRDEIAGRIARYAALVDAPVVLQTAVQRLERRTDGRPGFRLMTSRGAIEADRVVVAAGGFHAPRIPPAGASLAERVTQLHSHAYRSEAALPPGGVLVVGSGQSGVQIAEELHEAGRHVHLSVGRCGRVPRRYRGSDIFHWLKELATRGHEFGTPLPTVDKLPDPRLRFAGNPHLSGHKGGHDTNLRQFAADGITLVGHLEGADGERVTVAPDLAANLQFADGFFEERMKEGVDTFIERAGIDAPPDDRQSFDYEPPEVDQLDLAREGISTVIWTSGYRLDFGWIDLPILDAQGAPRNVRGVTEVPGLYFLGLPWMHDQSSATLFGVGRDGAHLAEQMEAQAPATA
jgi:putative flavoprotein involved in K+ transport